MDSEYSHLVENVKRLDAQLGALLKQGNLWVQDQTIALTDNALAGLQEWNQTRRNLISQVSEDDEALMLHLIERRWPRKSA